MNSIKFHNTWKIIELIETLQNIKELKSILKSLNSSKNNFPGLSETFQGLKLFLELDTTLEDILKKACILSFIAEFEYYFISIIGHPKFKNEAKKTLREKLLRGLTYKNIKNLFEENFWRELEEKTLTSLESKYGKGSPRELYPFDDFVKIRNYLAHHSGFKIDQFLIELETLKRTIEYMETLLTNLWNLNLDNSNIDIEN